jgi:hypothetical protein
LRGDSERRAENFQGLGFTSEEQVANAQLGDPLKVFIVPLDGLTAYKGEANASALLHDAHKSIYPVTVDQQVVSSLSATQREDGWRASDFGNSAVTRALAAHRAGKDDFVVWVPALKVYFTARGEGEALVLLPSWTIPGLNSKLARLFRRAGRLRSCKSSRRDITGCQSKWRAAIGFGTVSPNSRQAVEVKLLPPLAISGDLLPAGEAEAGSAGEQPDRGIAGCDSSGR